MFFGANYYVQVVHLSPSLCFTYTSLTSTTLDYGFVSGTAASCIIEQVNLPTLNAMLLVDNFQTVHRTWRCSASVIVLQCHYPPEHLAQPTCLQRTSSSAGSFNLHPLTFEIHPPTFRGDRLERQLGLRLMPHQASYDCYLGSECPFDDS